jgi:molybdopterin converting factor small subunit
MAVRVSIPTALRQFAGGNGAVSVEGATVGDALKALTTQYPDLGNQLMQNGELRNFVNVYLNDDDVRYLQGMGTPIGARDEISIIPAIAGGRGR